jgi:hypothetical protein
MSKITYECFTHDFGSTVHNYCPFCRNERLTGEIEQLRVQLAGCYQDVADAVGRELKYREALEQIARPDFSLPLPAGRETKLKQVARTALERIEIT